MADELFKFLNEILCERDISFDSDLLKSVVTDLPSRTSLQHWVDEYLSPETLLSKDELRLFTYLTETGEAKILSKNNDLSCILELNEQEVCLAISELKKSTVTIEKQSENLRAQQNALSALCKSIRRARQTRTKVERTQVRKWELESNSVAVETSDLVQNLIYQNSHLVQYLKTTELNHMQVLSSITRSDDELLASFQKLANDLDTTSPDNEETLERVKDLCARYIKFTVEGVRTKLDRIFLESLKDSANVQTHQENGQEGNELQEELESLYTEIQSVAQISVEQQYLEPALRMTNFINNHSQKRFFRAVEYIEDSLTALTSRVETYLEKAHETQCHRMAVKAIIEIVKTELSYQEVPTPKTNSLSQSAQTSHRLSDKINKEIKPGQEYAQRLGITLPKSDLCEETSALKMEEIISERSSRLESQEAGLESMIESSISSHVANAHLTLTILRDVLLDKTTYREVTLIEPKLLKIVDDLETEVSQVQAELDALDLYDLQLKDVQNNRFLEHCLR